ncbi:MAG TPA: CsbD family protein [Methylomirabilota bacterium]|nr:CsbD family protein [Methylomirabilota bacterium]
MNQDILAGKWKQMRGQLKEWWGKLTDDDLDKVDGKLDKLIGVLQEKYGYAKEQAEAEIRRRFELHDRKHGEEAGVRR